MKKFDIEIAIDLKATYNEVHSLIQTHCNNSMDVRMVENVLDALEHLALQGGIDISNQI